MGLRCGEYGGRNSRMKPSFVMACLVFSCLWKLALSITMTALGGSFGISC